VTLMRNRGRQRLRLQSMDREQLLKQPARH
jgi:hypothetical protein